MDKDIDDGYEAYIDERIRVELEKYFENLPIEGEEEGEGPLCFVSKDTPVYASPYVVSNIMVSGIRRPIKEAWAIIELQNWNTSRGHLEVSSPFKTSAWVCAGNMSGLYNGTYTLQGAEGASICGNTAPGTYVAAHFDNFQCMAPNGNWQLDLTGRGILTRWTICFEASVEGECGEGEGVFEGEGVLEGQPEGEGIVEGEEEGQPDWHTADPDKDNRISLSELLRLIQFFNSDGFHCMAGTEDGYAPGPGDQTCAPHDSDYNSQDWRISLSELLRLIQFFNSGGYHYCPGENTEDGFCPGL